MKTKIYLSVLFSVFVCLAANAQQQELSLFPGSTREFFNERYWHGVADKRHLSAADRTELIEGAKRMWEAERSTNHRHFHDSELVWVKQPSSSKKLGGASTYTGPCTNIDFEAGNMTGWVRSTGFHPVFNTTGCCPNPNGAQAIMTGAGVDPYGGFPVVAPGGGNFSLRLGNNALGAIADRIEQTFSVTPQNANFTYQYAVVLNDPGHIVSQQPAFTIEMIDTTGFQVPCTMYTVAAASNIPGFFTSTVQGGSPLSTVVYKPWTTVALDLTPNMGQIVTLRFTTYDCSQTGHFGYAYVDGSCNAFETNFGDTTCPDVPYTMCGPSGYNTYFWSGPGSFTSTSRCIAVTQAGTYSCQTTIMPGCPGPTFNHTLYVRPKPVLSFTPSTTGACALQYTFASTSSIAPGNSIATYTWSFGDNNGTFLQSPAHNYTTYGTYPVEFKAISNYGCSDSVTQNITIYPFPQISYSPPSNCINTVVQFTNTSSIPNPSVNSIVSYTWNLGNGIISNAVNPTNTYSVSGPYNVTLSATSDQGCISSASSTLGIFPPPVLDFSASNLCFGSAAAFTSTTTIASGTLVNFSWDFGDGTGASTANANRTFTAPGNYLVTFSATSNHNCIDSVSKTITIHELPVVSFTNNAVCLNSTTSYTNTSSIPFPYTITSFTWDFGNGNTSNLIHPLFTFTASGTKATTLTAESNMGCRASTVISYPVHHLPQIFFSPQSVCANTSIQFTNTSFINTPDSIVSYNWDFGNGFSTNSVNPVYTFTIGNNYQITLIATSDKGCKDTMIHSLPIYPVPVANFSVGNSCQNSVLTFSNNSTVASPDNIPFNNWNFGDGGVSALQSPGRSYTVAGNYTVSLTTISNHGCTDTYTMPVTIHPLPTLNIVASAVCPSVTTTFTNNSQGAFTYTWNFGDGTPAGTGLSPTHTYISSNNYIVQVDATSNQGCTSTGTTLAVVHPMPQISFSPPGACQSSVINFTNTSTIASGSISSYFWDFGNGVTSTQNNPVYTYPSPGSYTILLTAVSDQSCIVAKSNTLEIYPVPAVNIVTISNVCMGSNTQFTGTTGIAPGHTVTFHNWNFGNGFFGTGQNTAHTYANTGTFVVTFSATSNNNCTATDTRTLTIHPVPQVSFAAAAQCEGAVTSFTNYSTIGGAGNSINQWAWNFDDGSTSILQNPPHTYSTFGTYSVALTATSNLGCVASGTAPVVVHPVPNISFSPPSACVGAAIQFTNTTVIALGSVVGYTWNLGNSSTSNLVNPVYSYSVPNNYSVTLAAISDMGCSDVLTTTLGIHPYPQVNVTALQNGCVGDAVTFNSNIVLNPPPNLPSSISSFTWNYGNGTYSVVGSPTLAPSVHNYSTFGTYTVILSAISSANCQTDDSTTIVIYPKPNPSFLTQQFCHRDSTTFINTSTIPSGSITSHLWFFGDGLASSSLQHPKHVFSGPGTYTIVLNQTSNPEPGVACTHSVANTLTINPLPQPSFGWSPVCLGSQMNFANNTPTSGIVTWAWDFDNDGVSNTSSFNSIHTYSTSGIFTVSLRAQNNFSCVNAVTQTVQVYSNPTASFVTSSVCYNTVTSFTNLSTPGDAPNISSYLWKFTPADSSIFTSPLFVFPAAGLHTVELNVQSAFGCRAKTTQTVQVFELPVVNYSITSVCEGLPTQFQNLSYINDGSTLQYRWDYMNDGWDDSSATNGIQPFTYPKSGGFNFKLEALSSNGCRDTKNTTVVVYAKPQAAFLPGRVCVGDNIVFTDLSTSSDGSIVAHVWDFNGDDIPDGNQQNPSYTYTLNGNYEARLTVITEYGCTDAEHGFIFANPKAKPAYRSDKTDGCPPLCVNFQDISTISSGTFSTTWNFGDLSPVTGNRNPTHCFNSGVYDLRMELVTDSGCVSVLEHPMALTVYDNPVAGFQIIPDEVDADEPNIAIETRAENAVQTRYYINDGTTYSTADFTHNLKNLDGKTNPMIVQVVKNELGCSDTVYNFVKIKPAFALYVPDAFSPNGDDLNDTFFAKGVGIAEFEMRVYDRWGHLVFMTNDITKGWDGRNGTDFESIKQDVYTWKASVLDINKKQHSLVGHVTLIK